MQCEYNNIYTIAKQEIWSEIALHPILHVKIDMTSPARTPSRRPILGTEKKRGWGFDKVED